MTPYIAKTFLGMSERSGKSELEELIVRQKSATKVTTHHSSLRIAIKIAPLYIEAEFIREYSTKIDLDLRAEEFVPSVEDFAEYLHKHDEERFHKIVSGGLKSAASDAIELARDAYHDYSSVTNSDQKKPASDAVPLPLATAGVGYILAILVPAGLSGGQGFILGLALGIGLVVWARIARLGSAGVDIH